MENNNSNLKSQTFQQPNIITPTLLTGSILISLLSGIYLYTHFCILFCTTTLLDTLSLFGLCNSFIFIPLSFVLGKKYKRNLSLKISYLLLATIAALPSLPVILLFLLWIFSQPAFR